MITILPTGDPELGSQVWIQLEWTEWLALWKNPVRMAYPGEYEQEPVD